MSLLVRPLGCMVQRNLLRYSKLLVRGTGGCGVAKKPGSKGYEKLKKLQILFQKKDGKPVWRKTKLDDILYRVTWGLCILGLLLNFHLYFGYIL